MTNDNASQTAVPNSEASSLPPFSNSKASLENAYLKIFRYTVVTIMTLALIVILVMMGLAANKFFQTPVEPPPAKTAPDRAIGTEDLKRFLIDQEKRRQEEEKRKNAAKENVGTVPANQAILTPAYEAHVSPMYECIRQFGRDTDANVVATTEKAVVWEREDFRAHIESRSIGPFKGESWVGALRVFVCVVLKDQGIIDLRKEGKISRVVGDTINFHEKAYVAFQKEKFEFDQAEKLKYEAAKGAEILRVTLAKAQAITYAMAAGGAFLTFLALALYLIFARIESNLGLIYGSIVNLRR